MNKATIRDDFPFFRNPKYLHYLDNAATSQKPDSVISRVVQFYKEQNSNVHRGVYRLGDRATSLYEEVRTKVAKFLGGVLSEEIVFTSGTTESINLVASTLGENHIQEGDEILLTRMEHHANIVPWQMIANKKGATIKYIKLDSENRIDLEHAKTLFSHKTKVLAFSHVSNVLGYINPLKELCKLAREFGAFILIDGAQSIAHFSVDLKNDIDCDFYVFSAHKMLGPTGVGVLYGRLQLLNKLSPYKGGGSMIMKVMEQESTWNVVPNKFEAGTPNISGVMGLGAAIDYLNQLDRKELLDHELHLAQKVFSYLSKSKHITLHTKSLEKSVGVISFSYKSIHPHDLAGVADSHDVCIRAGHHCAQLLMKTLNVAASSRVSFYIYNNEEDVDAFLKTLETAEKIFLV